MAQDLPGGTWQTQGMRNASIANGVLSAELLRRDGTWVTAQANLVDPSLSNFNGVFIPSQSEPHLRALANAPSSGSSGGVSSSDAQLGSSAITAGAAITAAIIAAAA